jgi:hypothetical protein
MTVVGWPHGHLAHALTTWLKSQSTSASTRIYAGDIAKDRTYPLVVVAEEGLGSLGTDSAIQADEVRIQVDSWADRRDQAMMLAAEIFSLWDARFANALKGTTLSTVDGTDATKYYATKIERIHRAAGDNVYLDEFARIWRVTSFYVVKVNL